MRPVREVPTPGDHGKGKGSYVAYLRGGWRGHLMGLGCQHPQTVWSRDEAEGLRGGSEAGSLPEHRAGLRSDSSSAAEPL